jgi:hypothetical protein
MSELTGLPQKLRHLLAKWDVIVRSRDELVRVGVRPKLRNMRGLQSLLSANSKRQLVALMDICARRWAAADSRAVRDFWANRQQIVEETIGNLDELKAEQKVRQRTARRRMAAQWEEEYAAEKRRILDPRLGLGLSTNSIYHGGSRTVQGGAPGSGKRR